MGERGIFQRQAREVKSLLTIFLTEQAGLIKQGLELYYTDIKPVTRQGAVVLKINYYCYLKFLSFVHCTIFYCF